MLFNKKGIPLVFQAQEFRALLHMGKHNVCYLLAEKQQHRSASPWQGAGRVGFISLNFIYRSIKHSVTSHFLEVTKGRKSSIY